MGERAASWSGWPLSWILRMGCIHMCSDGEGGKQVERTSCAKARRLEI